jgi:hypothetical protein
VVQDDILAYHWMMYVHGSCPMFWKLPNLPLVFVKVWCHLLLLIETKGCADISWNLYNICTATLALWNVGWVHDFNKLVLQCVLCSDDPCTNGSCLGVHACKTLSIVVNGDASCTYICKLLAASKLSCVPIWNCFVTCLRQVWHAG